MLERLVEKGKILVRRAYADWNRFILTPRAAHVLAHDVGRVSETWPLLR